MNSQGASQQKSDRPQRSQGRYKPSDFKGDQNGYGNGVDPLTNGEAGPPPRVDITKLKMPALKKYTKVFDIQGVHQASTRDELETAVSKHWNATQVVEPETYEMSVLQNLLRVRGRGH